MSGSAQFAALNALIDIATTALGTTCVVFDGPDPASAAGSQDYLLIGTDGGVNPTGSEGFRTAAVGTQMWAALGKQSKDDDFDIPCVAVSWSESTYRELRARAQTYIATLESTLRTNYTLNQTVNWCGVGGGHFEIQQIADPNAGWGVQVLFTVTCTARI